MARFNQQRPVGRKFSPVRSQPPGHHSTHQGAPGYARDMQSELFLLSVTNLVGMDTHYESATTRDTRYGELVAANAQADPQWTLGWLRWLRNDIGMRTASVVAGVHAMAATLSDDPDFSSGAFVNAGIGRADEPGEALAYWQHEFPHRRGKGFPNALRRGVALAAERLYTEKAFIRYDRSGGKEYGFDRVLQLCHPTVYRQWQSDLFSYILTRRYNTDVAVPSSLPMLKAFEELFAANPVDIMEYAPSKIGTWFREAGVDQRAVSGWMHGRMTAKAYEALISGECMYFSALRQNLRNFDEAGISDYVALQVARLLADPDQVRRSREFPLAFLQTHRNMITPRWATALDRAMDLSVDNVPTLDGHTLIMIDTSTSMQDVLTDKSTDGLQRWDAAVLFGLALARRCAKVDVVSYSDTAKYYHQAHGVDTKQFHLRKGESLLYAIERWKREGYFLEGGTQTALSIRHHLRPEHTRLVLLTDEQGAGADVESVVPSTLPFYTWNLAGYSVGHSSSGSRYRHTFGGFTDHSFRMIDLIERQGSARWPWLENHEPVA